MKNDSSEDEDRTEWDTTWRNRALRQLVTPVQVDVLPTPNVDWGKVTRVEIAIDPSQYAESGWRKTEICPICGSTTTDGDPRLAVTIYPYFLSGFSYGLPAWVHESCYAGCEEIPGPAPVPW